MRHVVTASSARRYACSTSITGGGQAIFVPIAGPNVSVASPIVAALR
jgi:hypothetical protein